jgi:SnoaL-like domain
VTHIPFQIANFFAAMQAGRAAATEMEAAFAEDALYIEPFSGQVQRHRGRAAIMQAMARGWDYPLPEMRIRIDHAETAGPEIRIRWTCLSPGLPGGRGSGTNRYRMRPDGLIAELETVLEMGAT